jgi:hypothetical protein
LVGLALLYALVGWLCCMLWSVWLCCMLWSFGSVVCFGRFGSVVCFGRFGSVVCFGRFGSVVCFGRFGSVELLQRNTLICAHIQPAEIHPHMLWSHSWYIQKEGAHMRNTSSLYQTSESESDIFSSGAIYSLNLCLTDCIYAYIYIHIYIYIYIYIYIFT